MIDFKRIGILLLFIAFSNFVSAQNFKINGTVSGLADGTWLYLSSASPSKILDSAQVSHGKFQLSGKMAQKTSNVYLHTAKYTNYLGFWIEETPLTISLKSGEFKNALIRGSKTQLEQDMLTKELKLLTAKEDSLVNLAQKATKDSDHEEIWAKVNQVRNQQKNTYINFVKTRPNSLVAANILDVYARGWGKEITKELFDKFDPLIKQSDYGKNIKTFLTYNQEIKIGGPFADFEQANTTGKMIKLSNIKAKYILLEFWGSWCGPCRAENPNLVKTYNTYKQKGFEILGVAADDNKEQWLRAIKDDQLPWENVSDLKGDKNIATLIYGINAFPTNFLIDEKGIIIAKNLRGSALANKLAELLP